MRFPGRTVRCRPPEPIERCLELVFGQPVEGVQVLARPWRSRRLAATTRPGVIRLWIPCQRFWSSPELVLHEYYHVLEQWGCGRLTRVAYVREFLRRGYEGNRFEVEARAFAREHAAAFAWCLAGCAEGPLRA